MLHLLKCSLEKRLLCLHPRSFWPDYTKYLRKVCLKLHQRSKSRSAITNWSPTTELSNFVKTGPVVPEICSWTDTCADRQTNWSQYSSPLPWRSKYTKEFQQCLGNNRFLKLQYIQIMAKFHSNNIRKLSQNSEQWPNVIYDNYWNGRLTFSSPVMSNGYTPKPVIMV